MAKRDNLDFITTYQHEEDSSCDALPSLLASIFEEIHKESLTEQAKTLHTGKDSE